MMQTSHARQRHDPPLGRLDRTMSGGVARQRHVWPVAVAVGHVLPAEPEQVPLAERDHVIERLAAQGANPSRAAVHGACDLRRALLRPRGRARAHPVEARLRRRPKSQTGSPSPRSADVRPSHGRSSTRSAVATESRHRAERLSVAEAEERAAWVRASGTDADGSVELRR